MPLKCAKLLKLTKKRKFVHAFLCGIITISCFSSYYRLRGHVHNSFMQNIIILLVGNSIFERIKIRSANNLSRYEKVKKHIFWLFVYTWRTIFEALINRLVKKVILRANVFCCCLPQNDQKTEVLPTAIAREETHNKNSWKTHE